MNTSGRLANAAYGAAVLALVCLPLYFSRGKLLVGGDTILPFYAQGVRKYLWQWMDLHNGVYFVRSYFSQYFYYRLFDLLTDNVYWKASLLLLFTNALAALGICKLLRFMYGSDKPLPLFLATAFYLLSPTRFNGWHYLQIYAVIPWFVYLVLKIIKSGEFRVADVLWLEAVVFCAALDLPNPKYLFHLFAIAMIALAAALKLGEMKPSFFKRNWAPLCLFIGGAAYLYVPQAYFVLHYSASAYGTAVKAGYTNEAAARMMDYGTATADKMVRLFHDGMAISPAARLTYLSSWKVVLSNFFFIGLILFYFVRNRGRGFYDKLFMLLTVVYLFFAIGPNPPFGFAYEYVVTKLSLLAFLRTTAGAVFFLSTFYAVLLLAALRHFQSARLNAAFASCLLLTGYPLMSGEYYRNWSPVNHFVKKDRYGMEIPAEYFRFRPLINAKRLGARVLTPGTNLAYINTSWGYFGPGALYTYLYDAYFIGNDSLVTDPGRHGIGYVFWDDSLYDTADLPLGDLQKRLSPDLKEGFLRLEALPLERFLPMAYAPSAVLSHESPGAPLDAAVITDEAGSSPADAVKPLIEYRRISPSKYRIIAHRVRGDFLLILSEQFHPSWNLYIQDANAIGNEPSVEQLANYKLLQGNEKEQATSSELSALIAKGAVATLGDGKRVDFVSKESYGSVQNDNLPASSRFETLFEDPVEAPHFLANGFANCWSLKRADLQSHFGKLLARNQDGTYDLALVAEFYPEKVFDLSALVSLLSLALGGVLWLKT